MISHLDPNCTCKHRPGDPCEDSCQAHNILSGKLTYDQINTLYTMLHKASKDYEKITDFLVKVVDASDKAINSYFDAWSEIVDLMGYVNAAAESDPIL